MGIAEATAISHTTEAAQHCTFSQDIRMYWQLLENSSTKAEHQAWASCMHKLNKACHIEHATWAVQNMSKTAGQCAAVAGNNEWHWLARWLLDDLVVQYQADGTNQQQANTPHDQLVGHDPSRHAGQDSSSRGNIVISPMQCVPSMGDCFTLPVQILQYTDSQFLKSTVNHFRFWTCLAIFVM